MSGKQAFEEKIAAVEALASSPSPDAAHQLRKVLKGRNNYVISKAAAVVASLALRGLVPDLIAAFDRFMNDPVKNDPKCWAKNAIVKALKDLEHDDPAIYLRGLKHVQLEPVWGGEEDSAITLRGACALALAACTLDRNSILTNLTDGLADTEVRVRMDVARAIAQMGGHDGWLLLRLKAQTQDEPEVIGQCFLSMLAMDPNASISFVAQFMKIRGNEIPFEAAAALGECPDVRAIEALIEQWRDERDPKMKRAIELSLGVSRLPEAKEFLRSLEREREDT